MITITVLRPGKRGAHGDPLPGTEHQVDNVIVAPRTGRGPSSTEPSDYDEVVVVGLTIYVPFDADIEATDQIRIDEPAWAGTYDVVGEPGRWQSPYSGRKAGAEIALTRTGASA